jgi:hypothetical protein
VYLQCKSNNKNDYCQLIKLFFLKLNPVVNADKIIGTFLFNLLLHEKCSKRISVSIRAIEQMLSIVFVALKLI